MPRPASQRVLERYCRLHEWDLHTRTRPTSCREMKHITLKARRRREAPTESGPLGRLWVCCKARAAIVGLEPATARKLLFLPARFNQSKAKELIAAGNSQMTRLRLKQNARRQEGEDYFGDGDAGDSLERFAVGLNLGAVVCRALIDLLA
jgi:hypothetical protein